MLQQNNRIIGKSTRLYPLKMDDSLRKISEFEGAALVPPTKNEQRRDYTDLLEAKKDVQEVLDSLPRKKPRSSLQWPPESPHKVDWDKLIETVADLMKRKGKDGQWCNLSTVTSTFPKHFSIAPKDLVKQVLNNKDANWKDIVENVPGFEFVEHGSQFYYRIASSQGNEAETVSLGKRKATTHAMISDSKSYRRDTGEDFLSEPSTKLVSHELLLRMQYQSFSEVFKQLHSQFQHLLMTKQKESLRSFPDDKLLEKTRPIIKILCVGLDLEIGDFESLLGNVFDLGYSAKPDASVLDFIVDFAVEFQGRRKLGHYEKLLSLALSQNPLFFRALCLQFDDNQSDPEETITMLKDIVRSGHAAGQDVEQYEEQLHYLQTPPTDQLSALKAAYYRHRHELEKEFGGEVVYSLRTLELQILNPSANLNRPIDPYLINGFSVNVRPLELTREYLHKRAHSPHLSGGNTVYVKRDYHADDEMVYGTIGTIIQADSGTEYLLSNGHVLTNSNLENGDHTFTSGAEIFHKFESDFCEEVAESARGSINPDLALAKVVGHQLLKIENSLLESVQGIATQRELSGLLTHSQGFKKSRLASDNISRSCLKFGAETGYTTGEIYDDSQKTPRQIYQ